MAGWRRGGDGRQLVQSGERENGDDRSVIVCVISSAPLKQSGRSFLDIAMTREMRRTDRTNDETHDARRRRRRTSSYDTTSMKSTPTVLETNGTEREARRLHSMTITSEPLARNCASQVRSVVPVIVEPGKQQGNTVGRSGGPETMGDDGIR